MVLLPDRPGLQARGEALRERVPVLACHDQMEGCAELGERERSIPVHVAQLPEGPKGKTRSHICEPTGALLFLLIFFNVYLKRTIFFRP